MHDTEQRQHIEVVVRGIATAAKTLRLYPPTSPIPQQAVETAVSALGQYLATNPVLSLSIAREGFTGHGDPIGTGTVGVSDLADMLREHGVAELDLLPGCDSGELMPFLSLAIRPAEEIRAEGGLGTLLAATGVESVRVVEVHLTVVEELRPAPDEDVDDFLRQLTVDPEKLATWMAAATAGDPRAFAEGLEELANVAGQGGLERLMDSLAVAFMRQESDSRDVLLGLALEPGTVRALAEGMFSHIGTPSIASALTDGMFGRNMLSLSNALAHLPLQERMAQVRDEVQALLAKGGRPDKEMGFLEHMLDVRLRPEPEPALTDADGTYAEVAAAGELQAAELERLRTVTLASHANSGLAGVTMMLTLLDQQNDFELYARSVDNLAAMVPRLLESGDFLLAERVLQELSSRESRAVQPWPELTARLRDAMARAVDQPSIAALTRATVADPSLVGVAREIVSIAGESAAPALVNEAVGLKSEGVRVAEDILGRRVLDLLVNALPSAQWYQLAPIVERLARENDTRYKHSIEVAMRRDDEQSRREIAQGLGAAGGTIALEYLAVLTRDRSQEVAVVAVRALSKNQLPGAVGVLDARLGELDLDGKDFLLGREIIGALARLDDPAADEVLARLAGRKALIKRGHFAEVQDLVRQAIAVRRSGGAA